MRPVVSNLRRTAFRFSGDPDVIRRIPRTQNDRADALSKMALGFRFAEDFVTCANDLAEILSSDAVFVYANFGGACSEAGEGGAGFCLRVGRTERQLVECFAGCRFLGSRSTGNAAEYQACHLAMNCAWQFIRWCADVT